MSSTALPGSTVTSTSWRATRTSSAPSGAGAACAAAASNSTGPTSSSPGSFPSGSLEQIIHRVDALHQLTERGVRVMNTARAIERSVDKFWTTALLEQCGLPTARDASSARRRTTRWRRSAHCGDVIVKPLFGSMGLGMVRVADEDMAYRVFRTIETIQGVYYLQRDHRPRRPRRPRFRARRSGSGRHRAAGARAGGPTRPGRRRAADRSCRTTWAGSPSGRRPRSAPSTPGWTCCRRATARCMFWRSTASRLGRAAAGHRRRRRRRRGGLPRGLGP